MQNIRLDREFAKHVEQCNFHVIATTSLPTEEVLVAMIEHNGVPVELMKFEKTIRNGK